MGHDENEDPEERLERERRARSTPGLKRLAVRSGIVAVAAFGVAVLAFVIRFRQAPLSYQATSPFGTLLMICCAGGGVIIGPLATLLDICLVIVLDRRGERDLDRPVVLAAYGVMLSLFFAVATLSGSF